MISTSDVEFWTAEGQRQTVKNSSIVPRKDEIVSMGGRKYKVLFVSYAVDLSGEWKEPRLCACVMCEIAEATA